MPEEYIPTPDEYRENLIADLNDRYYFADLVCKDLLESHWAVMEATREEYLRVMGQMICHAFRRL